MQVCQEKYFAYCQHLVITERKLKGLYHQWMVNKTLSEKDHNAQAHPIFKERSIKRKELVLLLKQHQHIPAVKRWLEEVAPTQLTSHSNSVLSA